MRAWDLNELRINNQAGLGATPNNQNVDYVGLRVLMKPLTFLKLALPIGRKTVDDRKTINYISQHLDDPGIGAPFLDLRIPEAWFSGDFSEPASVIGHDGRHRMYAAAAAEGNNPIEVHLFPRGGLRNRDLTPEIIQHLQQGLNAQGTQGYVRGPVFDVDMDQAVVEVAMNPTAFRQAVAQGQTEGVLVGYEFEVCIPEKTIQSQPIANTPQPELTSARVIELIHDHDPNIDRFDIEDREFGTFLDVFKFKNSNIKWPNVKTMRQAMMEAQLPDLIAAFEAIPKRNRTQHVRTVKDELERTASYRRMSRLGKQYKFAREFGQRVFYTSHGAASNQGLYLRKLGLRPNRLVEVLAWALGVTPEDVENNFLDYFTFDNPQAAYDYLELDDYERGDGEYEDWDPEYRKAAKILRAHLEATYQKNVVVFNDYHQQVKNLTDWYIEPDGSLDADTLNDATAEIVSPPYPAAEAMTVLNKFFGIAENLELYTNSSTGLHINVSIPKNLDVLKLAVLLGDQYVLKHYDREDSKFAQSVMRDLRIRGSSKVAAKPRDLAKLADMAKSLSKNHTASISYNGKYVSFRHAGGDYLEDPQGVTNTVGRFIQAMIIAADPTAYRNEYFTKLTKLFPEQPQLPGGSGLKADQRKLMAVINNIRMNGVPVIVQDTAGVGPIRPGETREMQQVSVEANSEAARQTMLDRIRAPGNRERIQALPLANFTRTTFIRPPEFLVPSTTDVERTAQNSFKFYTFTDSRLPPGHPAAINYIKAIAAPIMKRLRAQSKRQK